MMRVFTLFSFIALLSTTILAWEKEDHEIFDIVSELESAEGKGTSFYSWLDVPSTASTAEISKAYRKMSMQLHPDKNPGVKGVHERFARLGVVAAILRNSDSRKRYDFFYKNGVPKWRGTGYYYSRFRPGLGTVLAFLVALTSILQLVVERMNYKKDLVRMERFAARARSAAWGPKLVPLEGQRKVKINIATDEGASARWVEMVVEGQYVYFLGPSGDMHLLNPDAVPYPTFSNTWFLSLLSSLVFKIIKPGKVESRSKEQDSVELDDGGDVADGAHSTSTSDSGQEAYTTTEKTTRLPAVKAGGKRRKAIPRRR